VTRPDVSTAASTPDETLVRALARGRRWMADLIEGVHGPVVELAEAYRTNPHYVARHLPLACLSPGIVDAILCGRQPVMPEARKKRELTTWDLLNRIEIPLAWEEQKRVLGFP